MAEIYLDRALPCGPAIDWMKGALETEAPSPERCTQMVYDLVGANPKDQFLFTSSGAEAVATVHWTAFMDIARKEGKTHFITCALEDASMLQSLNRLEDLGCFVKVAPMDSSGRVDLVKLADLIGPRTAMISISLVHGLTGVIQPIEEISKLAQEKGILLHVDATYGLGKIVDPFAHADYLSFSGDQIHSVPGSGGVFAKEGKRLIPLIPGKIEQDTPSLIALGAAASQAMLCLDTMSLEVARLRDLLEQQLPEAKPLFQDAIRLPNVTVLSFPGVHHEMLHYTLKRKQIFGSIGGVRSPRLDSQLSACGMDGQTAISFSLSRYTTQAEIDRVIQMIQESIAALKPLAEDLCN